MSYDKVRLKKQKSIRRLLYVMRNSMGLFNRFSNLMEVKSSNNV